MVHGMVHCVACERDAAFPCHARRQPAGRALRVASGIHGAVCRACHGACHGAFYGALPEREGAAPARRHGHLELAAVQGGQTVPGAAEEQREPAATAHGGEVVAVSREAGVRLLGHLGRVRVRVRVMVGVRVRVNVGVRVRIRV